MHIDIRLHFDKEVEHDEDEIYVYHHIASIENRGSEGFDDEELEIIHERLLQSDVLYEEISWKLIEAACLKLFGDSVSVEGRY